MYICYSEMVMKEVFKAAKNNNCVKLGLWKDSISNMLWWSFATSSSLNWLIIDNTVFLILGNETLLREKILSIPLHLADLHSFPNNEQHKQCSHGDLTGSERHKPWCAEGSQVITVQCRDTLLPSLLVGTCQAQLSTGRKRSFSSE